MGTIDDATPCSPPATEEAEADCKSASAGPMADDGEMEPVDLDNTSPPTICDEEEPLLDFSVIEARRQFFHDNVGTGEHETGSIVKQNFTTALNCFSERYPKQQSESSPTWGEELEGIMSKVPHLLSDLETRSTRKNKFISNPRPSLVSRSIEGLEQSIRSLHQQRSRHPKKSQPDKSTSGVRSFTLRFNECSVACVSRWVAGQLPAREKNNQQEKTQTSLASSKVIEAGTKSPPFYFSSVNAHFRQCGVCFDTGHYELECPHQTRRQTKLLLAFAEQSSHSNAKEQHLSSNNTAMDSTASTDKPHSSSQTGKRGLKRPKPGWEASTELCKGFLVEQRADAWSPTNDTAKKKKAAQTSTKETNSADSIFDETHIDGFTIRASNKGSSSLQSVSFHKGDLVGWLASQMLNVGILLSSFDQGDEVDVRVRCIAVVSPYGSYETKSDNESMAWGQTHQISSSEIFSVQDYLPSDYREDQEQAAPDSSAAALGNSLSTSNPKEAPIGSHTGAKLEKPRGRPAVGRK